MHICTSKTVQLALIIASLVILPLERPSVIYAQSNNPQTNPVCNLNINKNQPGVFCERQNIQIVPGNSNNTEQTIRIEKERQAKLKKATAQSSSGTQSSDITILSTLYSQCVPFARQISGIDKVKGVARNIPVDTKQATVGSVVITYESSAGHAAYVTAVGETTITVEETNFVHGKKTRRVISKFSNLIKGYVLAV